MIHPIKHFTLVHKHRMAVMHHCRMAGIPWQGLVHDLSKFSPSEFIPGVKYYLGNKSPNVREREIWGYSSAWLHHKGRNKHHFEYWADYNIKKHREEAVRMPAKYLIEMFCDRVAACKIYQGSAYNDTKPLEYYQNGHAASTMHPETASVLEAWLNMLAEEGESATFAHIKGLHRKVYSTHSSKKRRD